MQAAKNTFCMLTVSNSTKGSTIFSPETQKCVTDLAAGVVVVIFFVGESTSELGDNFFNKS